MNNKQERRLIMCYSNINVLYDVILQVCGRCWLFILSLNFSNALNYEVRRSNRYYRGTLQTNIYYSSIITT